MSSMPPIVPTIAPARAIMLPASFGACGVLVLILIVALVGCGSFGTAVKPEEKVEPSVQNAVLCACECEGSVNPTLPSEISIRAGADDVTQASGEANAVLNRQTLVLGQGAHVGLRFEKLGVPAKATITEAYIQFTAAQADDGPADLDIAVVRSGNAAAFDTTTDLRQGLTLFGQVDWKPMSWAAGERQDPEKTANVSSLVQEIVNHPEYKPSDGAIAFVITGSGTGRVARASEQPLRGAPAALIVKYTPPKFGYEIQTCGNPADAVAICTQKVQSNLSQFMNQCILAKQCTCRHVASPDPASFSAACNGTCERYVPQGDDKCAPAEVAKMTAASDSHAQVCIANSPLGSALLGHASTCEIDSATSTVSVRVFDDDDSVTETSNARGRIQFTGTPCPGGSCSVGMTSRIHMNDVTFSGGLFSSDHTLVELSNVGQSTANALLSNGGTGTFGAGTTRHSVRGREDGGDTLGIFKTADRPIDVGLGGWQVGGACTMRGMLFAGDSVEVFADIKGRLINQPPTAVLGPEETVECNDTGLAVFALDADARDPDNNIASFAWLRGSRTGQVVGLLSTVELEQPVNTTTLYVFKAIDVFGQFAEAMTKISAVDTTPPQITAPPAKTVECTGHSGTPVDLGMATASDVCDASPVIDDNAPGTFPLGNTTVTWSAQDASGNFGYATQIVTVLDRTPPELTLQLSPTALWSPNHKLEPITASITVLDKCDPNPTVRLVSITSSEPDEGLGDGDMPVDIQNAALGSDDRAFLLRSERSGLGSGRVYTIVYEASDASGNTTRRTATVAVPKTK